MKYNPDKHQRPVWLPDRRSIRLKGYDYSQPGTYFVTICIQDRDCLLGKIENGEMQLNAAGQMIYDWWNRLPHKYPNIELDAFIVMPNHLHGLIIVGADPGVCPETELPAHPDNKMDGHTGLQENPSGEYVGSHDKPSGEHAGSPLQGPISLSRMVQWFKTMTTNEYIRNVKQNGWFPFKKHLWQRNYYEHIHPVRYYED